jgi:hypothetical protein
MNNLPKVHRKVVIDTNNDVRNAIKRGVVLKWINDVMEEMQKNNPVLFQYLKEQSMRFSLGITMAQGDVNAIAMSHLISDVVLLKIIDKSVGYKELPNEIDKITEKLLGDWLPEDFDFGANK